AEADQQLRLAAELDPQSAQPWLILARLQSAPAAALPLLELALQREPNSYEALMMRARAQFDSKDSKGARDSLQRAAQANAKATEPLVQLGMNDEAEGRRNEARRHYLAAIERDPHQPVALNNLVMMGLADKEDPARLEIMAKRAVKALPEVAAVHDTLAQVLRLRKDKAGALAAGQQAVKLAPKDPAMLLHLAELQQWNGDRTAARKSAEAVLALQAQGADADKARTLLARL
ncbi:MAG: tetratricopeptide repeat protein, partial [Inhella sp.]